LLVGRLPFEAVTEPARDVSARHVGLVVMDLDACDPGHRERGIGQQAGDRGCKTPTQERGVNPVSDLELVRAAAAVQATAACDANVHEDTEIGIAALRPFFFPTADQIASFLEVRGSLAIQAIQGRR
jgi:hypothetical protein